MKKMKIDVGREIIQFEIPDGMTSEVLNPGKFPAVGDLKAAIFRALKEPISSESLNQLVKPGLKVAIMINDNTRYVPQEIIVDEILKVLDASGVRKEDITIIIATGTHRPNTDKEIEEMLGTGMPREFKVINHSAYDKANLVEVGKTEGEAVPVVVNKAVAEADVKIGIGVIEPHLFAGYSGGVKVLAVGAAGIETIAATHNAKMLEHPKTRLGVVRGNLFREFLNETAKIVGMDFILNVVMDENEEVLGVFAGDPVKAHGEGVDFAKGIYEVKAARQADVVISVPKYPKTINLYQAIRAANGVFFGENPLVKKGGAVIIPARCWDGVGSKDLMEDLAEVDDPAELIQRAREKGFPPEGHKAFTVSRMLQRSRIYITDTDIPEKTIRSIHLEYAKNVDQALEQITKERDWGKNSTKHLVVLPDGIKTIPVFNEKI